MSYSINENGIKKFKISNRHKNSSFIYSATFMSSFSALSLIFGRWVGVCMFFRIHILVEKKWDINNYVPFVHLKDHLSFRLSFWCNHILGKENRSSALPPSILPKKIWCQFGKVKISLSNKWTILTSNTHLKSENSYKKSFWLRETVTINN